MANQTLRLTQGWEIDDGGDIILAPDPFTGMRGSIIMGFNRIDALVANGLAEWVKPPTVTVTVEVDREWAEAAGKSAIWVDGCDINHRTADVLNALEAVAAKAVEAGQ